MTEHPVTWTAPAPLWAEAASVSDATVLLRQPSILRFAADSFMTDFLAVLEDDPGLLSGLLAKPETWRGPTPPPKAQTLLVPTAPKSSLARKLSRLRISAARSRSTSMQSSSTASNGSGTSPLKLYQPAHQRYYLVSACLVCGLTGLPDRRLDAGRQERATFVIRRLLPPGQLDTNAPLPPCRPGTCDEYAFVVAPDRAGWQKIPKAQGSTPATVLPGEEQLPLFAVNYTEDDGRRRRLFAGVIPVGKREAYMGASQRAESEDAAPVSIPPPIDSRMLLVWSQVTEPWKRLIERADAAKKMHEGQSAPGSPSSDQPLSANPQALRASLKAVREQIQTVSWYILLDLAKFLQQYIENVWKALTAEPHFVLTDLDEQNLFNALENTKTGASLILTLTHQSPIYNIARVKPSLRSTLQVIGSFEEKLEKVSVGYDREKADPSHADRPDPAWPDFLFPLADPSETAPLPPPSVADPDPLKSALAQIDNLAQLIEKALPEQLPETMPAIPLGAQTVMDTREGWFVIRCVFERPNCGPLDPPIVSEPTNSFQLAGFFDPDAPARPIRIALPIDTSPAGLRKFDKNTAFMISDMLCGQIDRLKSLGLGDLVRSVLPWPLHKELSIPDKGPCKDPAGIQVGMICSLSIPIVTICALILLIIIVSLLDYIFRWLPYFFICFPLPGLKGKK